MKLGIAVASLLIVSSGAAFAEVDEFQEYSGWLREGYLHHVTHIPSADGEYFNDPCPSCGTFASTIESFAVARPQWDWQGDNNLDCDLLVEVLINGTWTFAGVGGTYTNEEYVNCGTACKDRYVRARVYDYRQANSGVVGVRFGKGHE